MTSEEKLQALFHSRTLNFKRRIEYAKDIIDKALDSDVKWFSSWSGGKDSSVVFDLAKTTEGIFADDEFWLPETEELYNILQQTRKIHWIRTNATHTDWFHTTGDYDGIQEYASSKNFSGVFLGLRRGENKYRRVYLDSRAPIHFVKKDKFWHCNPLSYWSTWDIWAYLISQDIPYNLAYDKLAELGVPIEKRRIGPFANARALTFGQLSILKQGWPEQYHKFIASHPEAARYL